jgi:hypothetical protein
MPDALRHLAPIEFYHISISEANDIGFSSYPQGGTLKLTTPPESGRLDAF